MSDIKRSFSELIGNTPLYAAERFAQKANAGAEILAKLEYFNPAGSVKDRVAGAMIDEAEASGALKPARPSSNRPAAIPVSALLLLQPHAAIVSSSPCLKP